MTDRRLNNDRKSRQNEDFDFAHAEQRRHRRVRSKAFTGIHVVLKPAPPFFGDPVDGMMLDLSGGGAAIKVKEAVLAKSKMKLWAAFPDRPALDCLVSVRRVAKQEGGGYLVGLQFLDMTEERAAEFAKISDDYDSCEQRIREETPQVCTGRVCGFFGLCDKPEKVAVSGL